MDPVISRIIIAILLSLAIAALYILLAIAIGRLLASRSYENNDPDNDTK